MLRKVWNFYYDGFRSMTIGRKLWIIILIKLFVLFVIMKMIFFPNFLNTRFDSDKDKGDYVRDQLIEGR